MNQFASCFPFWKYMSEEEKRLLQNHAIIKEFSKDEAISSSDSSCMGLLLLLSGGIRVSLLSEEGREITLFRLGKLDCCVTTASCVIQQITFDTFVTATEHTKVLVIPVSVFSHLVEENIHVRCFMYEIETKRFSQTIWSIQQILFKRFDSRLADFLLRVSEETQGNDLKLTQEEIAREVNSAREVVARMLRHFSNEGLVEVKRGHIILKDKNGLQRLL